MILLSHPTGNENVRQAALAFQEANLLGEFWTCISWNPDRRWNWLLPKWIRTQLSRRSFPDSIRPMTHIVPFREISRLVLGSAGLSIFSRHDSGPFNIDVVMRDLDRKVAARLRRFRDFDVVYGYEDGALETFRAAKDLEVRRIYDLPIGYWRFAQKIYEEECEREPEWSETLTGLRDSPEKLERKEEELKLADRIVVASNFAKRTLDSCRARGAVEVVAYGAPTATRDELVRRSGKLRVVFVGSLGQRKGLSYLLRATQLLGQSVELTLLGRKSVSNCRPLEAAVRTHRWIPSLPHQEVLRTMREHDVLVLPSLFEGFGLVILEAMAQGVPVITTPHSAGPDLINEGVDGFIVPIRSAEAIAEKLATLAKDRERVREMKLAARHSAVHQRWENYRGRLVEMARQVVLEPKKVFHADRP